MPKGKWWKACATSLLFLSMNSFRRSLYLALVWMGILPALQAQEDAEFDQLKLRYPETEIVIARKQIRIAVEMGEDGPFATMEEYERKVFMSDRPAFSSRDEIYFSDKIMLTDVEGYSLIPNGKKFSKEPISEPEYNDDLESSSFIDDDRIASFYFPGITKRARTELRSQFLISDPHFIGKSLFASGVPIDEIEMVFEMPLSVNMKFRFFNCEDLVLQSDSTIKKKVKEYRFKVEHMNAIPSEGGTPGFLHFAPHIVYTISHYEKEGQRIPLLGNLDDLHNWYCDFYKEVDLQPTAEMQTVIDSISIAHPDELGKLKGIFHWVQKHIKYIAITEGYSGFQSEDAGVTCSNRYGDCKAMSTLMVSMAHAMGIPLYPTWVGTRQLPYSYETLPTPQTDNHMIATYLEGEKPIFLDATYSQLPFGYSPPFIQGKQVLISKNCETYQLAVVPVEDADRNGIHETLKLQLNPAQKRISGNGTYRSWGLRRMEHIESLERTKDEMQWVRSMVLKGDNNFHLNHYTISGKERGDDTLVLEYAFDLDDYLVELDGEVFLNPFLEKPFSGDKMMDSRKLPLEIDYKSSFNYQFSFEKDPSFQIAEFPSNAAFSSQDASMKISLSEDPAYLHVQMHFLMNDLLLEPQEFEAHNQFVKQLKMAYRQNIKINLK